MNHIKRSSPYHGVTIFNGWCRFGCIFVSNQRRLSKLQIVFWTFEPRANRWRESHFQAEFSVARQLEFSLRGKPATRHFEYVRDYLGALKNRKYWSDTINALLAAWWVTFFKFIQSIGRRADRLIFAGHASNCWSWTGVSSTVRGVKSWRSGWHKWAPINIRVLLILKVVALLMKRPAKQIKFQESSIMINDFWSVTLTTVIQAVLNLSDNSDLEDLPGYCVWAEQWLLWHFRRDMLCADPSSCRHSEWPLFERDPCAGL